MAIAEIEIEWGLGPGGFGRLDPDEQARLMGFRNWRVKAHNAKVREANLRARQPTRRG